MASLSNMQCWHVCVYQNDKKKGHMLLQKRCMDVKEANDLLAIKKAEFPFPAYTVTKERF
jgi:hypothetical protein